MTVAPLGTPFRSPSNRGEALVIDYCCLVLTCRFSKQTVVYMYSTTKSPTCTYLVLGIALINYWARFNRVCLLVSFELLAYILSLKPPSTFAFMM